MWINKYIKGHICAVLLDHAIIIKNGKYTKKNQAFILYLMLHHKIANLFTGESSYW